MFFDIKEFLPTSKNVNVSVADSSVWFCVVSFSLHVAVITTNPERNRALKKIFAVF